MDERRAMVAVMLVNNEIGVIQPVAEIARMAHEVGALMLCDAVQGFGRIEIPEGPDLIAISGAQDPWAQGRSARCGCATAPSRRR